MTASKFVSRSSASANGQAAPIASRNRTPGPKVSPAVQKLLAVEKWASGSVVGRAAVLRAMLLAVVGGQNALLLGPPGTAKTYAVRKVAQSFASNPGDVFEILLTKFTKPYEVFGPVDLQAMEQGRVEVNTGGFLPSARVGIVDEVFKASSAILNSMLQIANERTFKNGSRLDRTRVRTMVGMSNEFPEDPALLAAFFDRFPVKLMVDYLPGDDFGAMLKTVRDSEQAECPVTLTDKDFAALDSEVRAVEVPESIIDALGSIRSMLKAKGIVISDRRFVQAMRLLQASAVLAGRDTVARADLAALELVCWNQPQDLAVVRAILPDYLSPFERELRAIVDEVYEERRLVLRAANLTPPGGKPEDATRPSPDMVKATEIAAKSFARIGQIASRIELIETDGDVQAEEQMALARNSISEVREAIKAVCKGKAGLEALAATEGRDVSFGG